jgi:hypothetical protein
MGRRERANFKGNWPELDWEFWDSIFGSSSEKGNTRKHTKKRVTSWSLLFWRNFENLR